MKYISLFKQYSIERNISDFENIYRDRFQSESTYHFPMKINGYDAFMYYHPEIANQLSKIYRLDKEVKESFDKLPGIAKTQYIKKSLIDEIEMTNNIEGVLSTRQEIRGLIDDISSRLETKDRFFSVVNKYFMLHDLKEIKLNTCEDVRKLYDEFLFDEIASENPDNLPDGELFRKDYVHIEKTGGEIIHTGINSESLIIRYMDASLNVLNDEEMDPVLRVSLFHYLFEYIHPFYDGNGRMVRFITSYVFSKYLTPVVSYRLSMTIKQNLSLYYDAFRITNDKRNRGDIGAFVNIFLKIVIDCLGKTIEYAKEKNKELNDKWDEFKHNYIDLTEKEKNYSYFLMQAKIFSEVGITISEIGRANGGTPKTIRANLQVLIDKGIALRKRIGARNYYCLK